MTEYQIAHDGTGFRVYATTDGIDREWRGPRWATPRQAIAYADLIAATPSPLRFPAEPSPVPALPHVGAGQGVDGSAGEPRGSSNRQAAGG